MDSIVSTSEDSVPQQSAIVESAEQYQQVQQSLSDFYVPDYSQQSEVAELQAKIDEAGSRQLCGATSDSAQ